MHFFHKLSRTQLRSWAQSPFCFLAMMVSLSVFVFGAFGMKWNYLHGQQLGQDSSFWGMSLSGMTRYEAREKIEDYLEAWEEEMVVVEVERSGQVYEEYVRAGDFGFSYDVKQLVDELFEGAPVASSLMASGLHGAAGMDAPVRVDQRSLEAFMQRVMDHERSAKDAQIVFDDDLQNWVLQESVKGFEMTEDQEAALMQQLQAFAAQQLPEPKLTLAFETVEPEKTIDDLREGFEALQNYLQKTIYFVDGPYKEVFSFVQAPDLLQYDEESQQVTVQEAALDLFFASWAERFEEAAGTAMFGKPEVHEKGHLVAPLEGDFQIGRRLKTEAMKQAFEEALLSEEMAIEIPVQYEQVAPQVFTEDGRELSFLAQGRSSYAQGNGEDRVFNVHKGLGMYDGVVIPQGEEFSFNQVLGWVTYDAGWRPALAIFGGGGVKPVPGGGLCQVSTTVYRAAIHAGLPITQRKPHSLDVSYYHAYGDGIDATVYPPEDINLKFLNDTPGDIYVRSYFDAEKEEAIVDFYGIDDGREVSLEQVVNRPVKLPSQVEYTDEISSGLQEVLQRGRIGRYVEWLWTIEKDGQVEERSIETLYPAAARKVRVGTGN